MKQLRIRRLLSLTLIFVIMLGIMAPVASASDRGFREFRPEMPFPEGPQWTEQEVACQSGENTLRGTLTVPDNVEGQMPVAILLHGLETDRTWCDDIAWILADHGIASVRFDYAGNGRSDGAQEDMSVSSLTLDTRMIIDYVQALEITDQENIFIVGKSMGAVAAMLASKSEGENIKAMCFWYPGFSVKFDAMRGYLLYCPFNPWFPPESLKVGEFNYGRQFLKEIQIMDFETPCREYEGSVLIIHGTDDFIVPIESSFMAKDLFQDCEIHPVPFGQHGFYGFQEIIALNDMLTFIQGQIG